METPTGSRWRKTTSDDFMFGDWKCDNCIAKPTFLREALLDGGGRRITNHRCADHMDLEALADLAHAAFERLSPEEQKRHRREQAISFVVGNLALDDIWTTNEQVARVIDLNEFRRLIRDTREAFHRLPIEDQRAYKTYAHGGYDDGDLNLPDLP